LLTEKKREKTKRARSSAEKNRLIIASNLIVYNWIDGQWKKRIVKTFIYQIIDR